MKDEKSGPRYASPGDFNYTCSRSPDFELVHTPAKVNSRFISVYCRHVMIEGSMFIQIKVSFDIKEMFHDEIHVFLSSSITVFMSFLVGMHIFPSTTHPV